MAVPVWTFVPVRMWCRWPLRCGFAQEQRLERRAERVRDEHRMPVVVRTRQIGPSFGPAGTVRACRGRVPRREIFPGLRAFGPPCVWRRALFGAVPGRCVRPVIRSSGPVRMVVRGGMRPAVSFFRILEEFR
ncbi:hypothetical protein DPM19_26215 [Actinomadura craniellae]|uniref:Uncharacterized protein n=1 Tax=Actinomadura craniellae TaxID=2231787 RepID=A0A365GZM0_9ACTN|nr:hypothetical protein DPM19_26215 [Actinomadura craniellae]